MTYNGWPLYRWVDDLYPGLATGQGLDNLGGYWYTIRPDGSPDVEPNPSAFNT